MTPGSGKASEPSINNLACPVPEADSATLPASVCVFCGARFGADPDAREMAANLGELLAREGITLVYGGGGVGLMGVMANAALGAGGKVVGVIPSFLLKREAGHPALTQCMGFDANGMPMSLQVVAKYFDDATMLRVAAAYETATPWRDRRPAVLTRETVS